MKLIQSSFKRYVLIGGTLGGVALPLFTKVGTEYCHDPLQLSLVGTRCNTYTRSSTAATNDLSSSSIDITITSVRYNFPVIDGV